MCLSPSTEHRDLLGQRLKALHPMVPLRSLYGPAPGQLLGSDDESADSHPRSSSSLRTLEVGTFAWPSLLG